MLRIRLSRAGRKKQPFFKIVVIPKSAGTKSRNYKAELGTHDPVNKETTIDADLARSWIAKGAQPTDTVHNLFIKHGVITGRKKEAHDKDPVEPKEEEKEGKEEKEEVEESTEDDEEKTEESAEEEEKAEEDDKEDEKEEESDEDDQDEDDEKDEETEEEKEDEEDEKGESGLESLDLTTRIINSLEDAGIDTVEKLKEKSEDDLKEVKGLGPKSIEKIMNAIK